MAAAALLLGPCAAAPAAAETKILAVNAQVVKPLTLTWEQDLNLGSLLLAPGTWSGATVSLSGSGVFTCSDARVTCSGATQPARYRVTGMNKQVVWISAPNVTLVNQLDPGKTLILTVDSPRSVTLTSSGAPGTIFGLGGSVTVSSAVEEGTYVGVFDVTVNY